MSYIYNLADTWDNAGTVFTAIKMNVTDVASNASSALLDLQVGGVSQFKVSKAGAVTAVGVAIPTISSSDTLSNKTLSSPTLSGTVAGSPTFSGTPTFARTGAHEVVVFNQTNPATYNLDVQWQDNGSVRWLQSVRTNSNDDFWVYNIARTSADISISAASGAVAMVNGATGQSGAAIPTISSTDTLSNKTLSSPTLSGTVAGNPTFTGSVVFTNIPRLAAFYLGADTDIYVFESATNTLTIRAGGSGTETYLTIGPSNVLQLGGVAIPTISSTDTLSNKTLSSPTLSGTISGNNITFTGPAIKIGDGTDTVAMTGTSPLLRVQGASFSTGITVRRDGNAEVGIQSTGTGNIGTWTAHNVQFMRNGSAMGGFDANAIFIGQVNNPRFYLYNNAGTASTLTLGADSADTFLGSFTNAPFAIYTNSAKRVSVPAAGGMVVGTAAIATNATDGFLYVPTCAGTPTGTPTTQTGTAPIVVDTTNNKLYFYSGGQWRDAGP